MAQHRTFQPEGGYEGDYRRLRDFLIRAQTTGYHFGRWDWMYTHGILDKESLNKIGIWEEDGQVVALAIHDCRLGQAYFPSLKGCEPPRREMLRYAQDALRSKEGKFRAMIDDKDVDFQRVAAAEGYIATPETECDAALDIGLRDLSYALPEGFSITSMADRYDPRQYRRVLWKGFNHEAKGEGPLVFDAAAEAEAEREMRRPNVNLALKIAVVAPDGNFASYCGMWQDPGSPYALVEPVATDPAYRKLGLGRAAVLEAVRRTGELGAKTALVGSSQQFYYSIGFRPFGVTTAWKRKGTE